MGYENHYQGIDDYAVQLIKYKARQLVGRVGNSCMSVRSPGRRRCSTRSGRRFLRANRRGSSGCWCRA